MNRQIPIGQINDAAAARVETTALAVPAPLLRGHPSQTMASSNGKGESDLATSQFSHTDCNCAETLHALANSVTAVLIHAQVLEWKLPPYSRLKRPVREIERHAQRSEALLKHLLSEFEMYLPEDARQEFCGRVPPSRGTMAAVRPQGPEATDEGLVKPPPHMRSPSAPGPGSFSAGTELTSICDLCTSALVPKEER